ncbi:hypothetical protein [Nevskia ramosa]|uniref:hypothetical protein n=1 Tax=Nevskia ramosa TaxID=64002 RepID=UPI003D137EBB
MDERSVRDRALVGLGAVIVSNCITGSDALAMITPVLEGRLQELRDHAALSRSTDGAFQQN